MDFDLPEDLKMLQTLARDFVKDQLIPLEKDLLGREVDLEGTKRGLPPEKESALIEMAKSTGLWGLSLPEELGGAGLGVLAACLVEEEMARTVIPFSLGDVTPILFDCNQAQKADYLLPVLNGQKTFYLALIEPAGDSGPEALKMTAARSGNSFILRGQKLAYARHYPADFALVFAVTDPDRGIRGGATCFLVDKETPGFGVSGDQPQSGWQAQVKHPVCLTFRDCEVGSDKILGEKGKAFALGKKYLPSRRIVRGARSVGAALRLLDTSIAYAQSWQALGSTISNWPYLRNYLADMASDISAARLLVHQAAWEADAGHDIKFAAARVGVFTAEMLQRVAGSAVMVKGGPAPSNELPLDILCRGILMNQAANRRLDLQKSILAGDILKLGTMP